MSKQEKVAAFMEGLGFVHSGLSTCWLLPGSAPQISVDDDAATLFYDVIIEARLDEQLNTRIEKHPILCACKAHIVYLDRTARKFVGTQADRISHLKQKGKTNE